MYGENIGLKKDFKEIFKSELKKKELDLEIVSFYESEIIENNFQSTVLCIGFLISILNFYLFYNVVFARDNLKKHNEDLYIIGTVLVFSMIFYFTNNLNFTSVLINILSSIGNSGISIIAVPENFGLYFIILTLTAFQSLHD